MKRLLFLALALVAAAGCDSMGLRHPVPEDLVGQAEVPGFVGKRVLVDPDRISIEQINKLLGNDAVMRAPATDTNRPLTQLALSSGGPRGAYGAGLLCGWTAARSRPDFDIVTGISTGALMGPYAFLGPAYDQKLKTAYTTITDKDVFRKRGKLEILFGADSAVDTTPLEKTIEAEIDQEMMDAIAAEYRKGRRFYVGTSDLDAQCLTIWDMGAIAASGRPDARKLFARYCAPRLRFPWHFRQCYFR
jgi:hypothetical protein